VQNRNRRQIKLATIDLMQESAETEAFSFISLTAGLHIFILFRSRSHARAVKMVFHAHATPRSSPPGQRAENAQHVLQGQAMPKAHAAQGYAIQDGQSLALCAR
jgi:hypothetical protein